VKVCVTQLLWRELVDLKWFICQAFIATLLSRLEANDGKFWSLLVKINDGTATMDVVISDQVCRNNQAL